MRASIVLGFVLSVGLTASAALAQPPGTPAATPQTSSARAAARPAWTPAGYGLVTANSGKNPGVAARSALVLRDVKGQLDVSKIDAAFRPNGNPAVQRHVYVQPSTNGKQYVRVVDYHYTDGKIRRQTDRLFEKTAGGGHALVYTHRFDFDKGGNVTRSGMKEAAPQAK